jgi:phosphoribosylanthranilate isomerase
LPGEIPFELAREIAQAVRGRAKAVALSVDSNLDAIIAMAQAVQPDILHLCGLRGALPPDGVAGLRRRLPGLPIMQAISVGGPETLEQALADARAFAAVADYLILDTQAPDISGIGASGLTHDWSISRRIVEESPIPVILAGGLSPENVAEAIAAVHPWGVDSLTRTNRQLPEGGFRKDIDKVAQFVNHARSK